MGKPNCFSYNLCGSAFIRRLPSEKNAQLVPVLRCGHLQSMPLSISGKPAVDETKSAWDLNTRKPPTANESADRAGSQPWEGIIGIYEKLRGWGGWGDSGKHISLPLRSMKLVSGLGMKIRQLLNGRINQAKAFCESCPLEVQRLL